MAASRARTTSLRSVGMIRWIRPTTAAALCIRTNASRRSGARRPSIRKHGPSA
jgi:hypothetical protein